MKGGANFTEHTNPHLSAALSHYEINYSTHDKHSIGPVKEFHLDNIQESTLTTKEHRRGYPPCTLTFPVVTQERKAWTILPNILEPPQEAALDSRL